MSRRSGECLRTFRSSSCFFISTGHSVQIFSLCHVCLVSFRMVGTTYKGNSMNLCLTLSRKNEFQSFVTNIIKVFTTNKAAQGKINTKVLDLTEKQSNCYLGKQLYTSSNKSLISALFCFGWKVH